MGVGTEGSCVSLAGVPWGLSSLFCSSQPTASLGNPDATLALTPAASGLRPLGGAGAGAGEAGRCLPAGEGASFCLDSPH